MLHSITIEGMYKIQYLDLWSKIEQQISTRMWQRRWKKPLSCQAQLSESQGANDPLCFRIVSYYTRMIHIIVPS
jgi:hypothetical protein